MRIIGDINAKNGLVHFSLKKGREGKFYYGKEYNKICNYENKGNEIQRRS